MRKRYKIHHTPARYSVDGKDHWSVLYLSGVREIFGKRCEQWDRAIDKSFETEDEAKENLRNLKSDNRMSHPV